MRVRLSPWLLHVVITVHWSLHSVEFFPALALSRRNAKVLSPAFLQAEHVLQVRFFWQAVSWSGWAEGDLLGAARWPEGLESSPPLVPCLSFLWRGWPWRAACPQAGRSSQFPAALVIRASLHPHPPPSPPARRSTLLGGCLRWRLCSARPVAAFPGGGGSRDLG